MPVCSASIQFYSTLNWQNAVFTELTSLYTHRVFRCYYKPQNDAVTLSHYSEIYAELEIRSVERGICPIATSTINERIVPIMAGCMAHEREGNISTSGLKSDVTVGFLDSEFL